MNIKAGGIACVLAGLISLAGAASQAETYVERFDRLHLQLVAQPKDQQDCGPVALFDSLMLASPDLSQTLNTLPGKSTQKKYASFLQQSGTRPSTVRPGPRLSSDGIMSEDLAAMGNDILPPGVGKLESMSYMRRPDDSSLLARALRDIVNSMNAGLTPVLFIGLRSPDGMTYRDGHVLLLLQVKSFDVAHGTATLLAHNSETFDLLELQLSDDGRTPFVRIQAPGLWSDPNSLTTLESAVVFQRTP